LARCATRYWRFDAGADVLVSQVVSGLMYGGGQRVALDLAAGLACGPGVQTLIVLLGHRIAKGFPAIGCECIQLATYDGRYNRPLPVMRTAIALHRLLRSRGVSIAHSHGWDADVITGLACRRSDTQHVAHQHLVAEWAASPRPVHCVRRLVTRLALRHPDTQWIAVSNGVKLSLAPLKWLPADSIRVVRNGVDLHRFRQATSTGEGRRTTIGVAARLTPPKGVAHLIEAVALLGGRGLFCDLRIAGDGPQRPQLERLVKLLGLSGQVSFLGLIGEMPLFYQSLDVFVLPSIAPEAQPLTILEAMATGLPVVSTNVPAIPEVVLDGITGSVVTAGDSQALADALAPIVQSKRLQSRFGAAGRLRVEEVFSADRMFGEVAGVYNHIVSAQKLGAAERLIRKTPRSV